MTVEGTDAESSVVAHEPAGLLRIHRAGWSAPQLMQLFGLSKQQLVHELNIAIDDESIASHHRNAPIHDETLPKDYA